MRRALHQRRPLPCARERPPAARGPRRAHPRTTARAAPRAASERQGSAWAPRNCENQVPSRRTSAIASHPTGAGVELTGAGMRCSSRQSEPLSHPLTLRRTASSLSRSCSRIHRRCCTSRNTPRRTGHTRSLPDSLRHRCRWQRSSPQRRCSHPGNYPRTKVSTGTYPSRRERTGERRPQTRTVSRHHRVRRCPCRTPPRA